MIYNIAKSMMNHSFSPGQVKGYLSSIVTCVSLPEGSGPLWFVFTLLIIELLFFWIDKIPKVELQMICVLALAVIGFVLNFLSTEADIWRIRTSLIMLPVFYIGQLIKIFENARIIHFFWEMSTATLVIATVISTFTIYIHHFMYGFPISVSSNYYNCIPLFYFNAVAGTLVWLNISRRISHLENGFVLVFIRNLLTYYGKNSIIILVLHLYIISRFVWIAYEQSDLWRTIISVMILFLFIALILPVIYLVSRTRLRVFFGK